LGEVVATGGGVQVLKVGDSVFHHAHHSEYDKFDMQLSPHVKISSEQMLPEVTLARFAAIVLSGSIRLSKIELGDKVALVGLGLIGQIGAQLFNLAGADVYAFDPVSARRKLAESVGSCLGVFDPTSTPPKDVVANITNGRGVDTLVDATGLSSLIVANVGLVRPMGQVVLLGAPFASYEDDLTPLLRQIFLKWLTVKGALERDRMLPPNDYVAHPYLFDVAYSLDLIRRGKIKTKPLVSHVVSPQDFKKSYEGLLNQKEEYTAVVIDWE
jgi:threonine dehydrogenase-like Zn-dependent dehydrogenase